MTKFSDLGIKPKVNTFIGDKLKISRILNTDITVLDFKIEASKQKAGTEYMTLQIEKQGNKNVVFTGSNVLMQQIKQVPKDNFPFTTVIIGDNEYYEFT